LRILKGGAGEITETDVKLASQAKAKILGFRVKANPIAQVLAEREKIRIMKFDVIYDLVEGVRKYMEKLFEPEIIRTDFGKVKTLVIFLTDKNRQIVGGRVVEGYVKKGTLIEIVREKEVKGRGKMINLQRNKKDIEQAAKGEEVGILYEGNEKIEKDDLLTTYTEERRV
jgi:translation initiation factor IF-2